MNIIQDFIFQYLKQKEMNYNPHFEDVTQSNLYDVMKEFYSNISAINPNDSLEGQYCVSAVIDVIGVDELNQIFIIDRSLAVKLETYLPILMSY